MLKFLTMLILYLMAKMVVVGGLENHMEIRWKLWFPKVLIKEYMESNHMKSIFELFIHF